jgi:hypothetical protein
VPPALVLQLRCSLVPVLKLVASWPSPPAPVRLAATLQFLPERAQRSVVDLSTLMLVLEKAPPPVGLSASVVVNRQVSVTPETLFFLVAKRWLVPLPVDRSTWKAGPPLLATLDP